MTPGNVTPGIQASIRRLVKPEHQELALKLYLATGNLYVHEGVPLDHTKVEIVAPGRGEDARHCEECGHPATSHADPYTICARLWCRCPRNDSSLRCGCGDAIAHGERGGKWTPP
ncbi:MAG: hypothetical protein Q8Q14_10795 [Gemmatimonadales bacterium]|nr:hypothetical protein [Gemmatimonadales bacterium]